MRPISDFFNNSFQRQKRKFIKNSTFDFLELSRNWSEIVGEQLAKHTVPQKLVRKNLIILTEHSTYAQHLDFLKPKIIEKIRRFFPNLNNDIQYIKFYVSQNFFEVKQKQASLSPAKAAPVFHKHSPSYQKAKQNAQELFDSVEDEDVKKLLVSLEVQRVLTK